MALTARWNDRTPAVLASLIACAGLVGASLLIPGYIRPGWLLLFAGLGAGCLVLAGVAAWYGQLSSTQAAVIVLFGDGAIVLAAFALADRQGGQVVGALLILSTMFTAIFMRARIVVLQIVIATGCSWVIVGLATEQLAVHAIRTGIFIVAVTCPAAFLLIFRRQLDAAVQQARDLATTDPLTGLLNRRGLAERTPSLLSRAARAGMPVGVLLIDVDHFKQVNDSLGHAAGDEVLRSAARTVLGGVRPEDLVARLGGEELAVVTVADAGTLAGFAERLRLLVQGQGTVTVSIGVALDRPAAPDDEAFLPALLDVADEFMYRAKAAGRNRVCVRHDVPSACS